MEQSQKNNTKPSSNNAGTYLASPKAKAAWNKEKELWEQSILKAVKSID